MDKARITVRLQDGRPAADRPAGNRTAAASTAASLVSTRSQAPENRSLPKPEADRRDLHTSFRPAFRSASVFPGSGDALHRRARQLVRHWAVPVAVAVAVGSLLGWICLAVFVRAGTPAGMVDSGSNIHLYVVQAAAFSDSTRAQAFASALQGQGLAAKLAGSGPTLVLVGVATDPEIPGPLGDALRHLKIAAAVKPYRPPAPPSRIEGIAEGQAVAVGLRKSIDLLGEAVDQWSQGHSGKSWGLDQGMREVDPLLNQGVVELKAAGRSAQADLLQRWRNDLAEVINRIEQGDPPGPVMTRALQAMDDYEQLIGGLQGAGTAENSGPNR